MEGPSAPQTIRHSSRQRRNGCTWPDSDMGLGFQHPEWASGGHLWEARLPKQRAGALSCFGGLQQLPGRTCSMCLGLSCGDMGFAVSLEVAFQSHFLRQIHSQGLSHRQRTKCFLSLEGALDFSLRKATCSRKNWSRAIQQPPVPFERGM